jgi:hypothetical protein
MEKDSGLTAHSGKTRKIFTDVNISCMAAAVVGGWKKKNNRGKNKSLCRS